MSGRVNVDDYSGTKCALLAYMKAYSESKVNVTEIVCMVIAD